VTQGKTTFCTMMASPFLINVISREKDNKMLRLNHISLLPGICVVVYSCRNFHTHTLLTTKITIKQQSKTQHFLYLKYKELLFLDLMYLLLGR